MSDLSRDREAGGGPAGGRVAGQPGLQDAREDLRAAASAIGSQASETKEQVGQQASSVLDEAKAQGAGIADAARERAEDLAEEGKAASAERAHGLAEAVRHVADDLEGTSPEIARHVRAAAESVEGVSAALRDRSVGDLISEVGNFARRQPGAFFGAAMVAGFALSRFAKSSADASPGMSRQGGMNHAASGSGGVGIGNAPMREPGRMASRGVSVSPRDRAGGSTHEPEHTTATGAPGWVPEVGAAVTATPHSHPATMAAASLGGAVAHRPGDAAPGSMPTDVEVATIPPVPSSATSPAGASSSSSSSGTASGRTL